MHTLPATIVCAIDFSQFTELVIENSILIASRFKSTLILLHTIHHPKDALYGTTDFERSGKRDKQKMIAMNRMHQLMKSKKVPWKPVVLFGDPVDEIPKYADNNRIDLVVAASHGISGIKRLLIGTVVERMARKLKQPLLVIRADKRHMDSFKPLLDTGSKMIICCDLTKQSEKMIEFGLMWAREFQLSVILLHAIETPINEDEIEPTTAPYSEVQQMLQERMKSKVMDLVPKAYNNSVQIEPKLMAGQAKDMVPRMAKQLSAAIIITGVRYHTALEKLLMGSTTEAILRHAPCSVITFNAYN